MYLVLFIGVVSTSPLGLPDTTDQEEVHPGGPVAQLQGQQPVQGQQLVTKVARKLVARELALATGCVQKSTELLIVSSRFPTFNLQIVRGLFLCEAGGCTLGTTVVVPTSPPGLLGTTDREVHPGGPVV